MGGNVDMVALGAPLQSAAATWVGGLAVEETPPLTQAIRRWLIWKPDFQMGMPVLELEMEHG